MTQPELNPTNYAQEVLNRSNEALQRAVAVVSPENPQANPLEVFPAPGEVRAEDEGLTLTTTQEAELRSAAAELGFGRETDRSVSELGLSGAYVVIEGGQPHKMVAEALLLAEDSATEPSAIFFGGSPYRKITGVAERASAERLGVTGETEYDVAQNVAESLPGFVKLPVAETWALGYDIQNGHALTNELTGQFTRIGTIGSAAVVMLRVDRENYVNEEGDIKYRKQPGTADILRIVDGVATAQGDDRSPIAFVTSATYQPSREVDATIVSLQTERVVGVATYGTVRLAKVKGEVTEEGEAITPAPAPINQLPGELYKLAKEVAKLERALRPDAEA